MEPTAVSTPAEEGGFVALNPKTGTTTHGETVEEAVSNLREATRLYLHEFPLSETSGRAVVSTFAFLCMPKLPRTSVAATVRALERLGFSRLQQTGTTW